MALAYTLDLDKDCNILPDGWQIVFESDSKHACSERALVLLSLSIPNEIVTINQRMLLLVPTELLERAKHELWQYDQENVTTPNRGAREKITYQNAIPGVVVYVIVICLVAWLASEAVFNRNWFAAGRIDGESIRNGAWWRTITALTLHSGIRHLAGNIVFGVLFGIMAGRLVGPGVAWLGIVVASAAANLLNTVLLDPSHRSIGASTAVFAALGLVAGFVWRAKLMAQDRWPYRLGPIVGGIALLAFTGTGDANTDIGAHLAGFVCGFAGGIFLTWFTIYLPQKKLQLISGAAALSIAILAWIVALQFRA